MCGLALSALTVVRKCDVSRLRWSPNRDTVAAIATALGACALSALLLLIPSDHVAGPVVLFGGIFFGCGVFIPLLWTLSIERSGLAGLGVHGRLLYRALTIQLLLSALNVGLMFQLGDPLALETSTLAAAAIVLLAGNTMEALLYFGFLHLRLERAFGVLPAIAGTSLLYVSWHLGSQLPLESDPLNAAAKLFLVGVMYQTVFALTRNLFSIWFLYQLSGAMLDYVVNVDAVGALAPQWPWALGTLLVMAATLVVMLRQQSTIQARGVS